MVVIHSVQYKNFLATGNTMTRYALDEHPTTLIVGANGSGKSTLLDAICFALYGRGFRNVNRVNFVNSINEKQLVVEIEFSTQNNRYLVRRGIKPTVFTIECNGEPIPEMPSVNEMQEYLEQYILKCNFKAFTQVVILGAASYVPFMRLTPAARREIIEDVLDIEVFSTMAALVKGRLTDTKAELAKAQNQLAVIKSRHALAAEYQEKWAEDREVERVVLQKRDAVALAKIDTLTESAMVIKKTITGIEAEIAKNNMHQKNADQISATRTRVQTKLEAMVQRREFLQTAKECPTCQQPLNDDHRARELEAVELKITRFTVHLTELDRMLREVQQKIEYWRELTRTLATESTAHSKTVMEIRILDSERKHLAVEIQATYNPPPEPPTELGDLDAITETVAALSYQKQVQEQCATLLKDAGIRTRIIQQYLPTINGAINHYLHALNFPVQFTLNDKFEETIKSRHRDEFTYENFSEGEKRRIDLALVLTWREVAKLKNSAATNIIIFDEIFDSSLDASGTDDFLTLVQSMGAETNAVVISHKTEMLMDKFSHVIVVEKTKGFSTHASRV